LNFSFDDASSSHRVLVQRSICFIRCCWSDVRLSLASPMQSILGAKESTAQFQLMLQK